MNGRVIIWEEWRTEVTEFTCAACAELNLKRFRMGEGPYPPLHRGCRCKRVFVEKEVVGGTFERVNVETCERVNAEGE